MTFTQMVVPESGTIESTGTEVLDEHIGTGHEFPDDGRALGNAQIDGDRTLSAVTCLEQRRYTIDGDADPPSEITESEPFDLDDLGSLIGEQRSRIGACERS